MKLRKFVESESEIITFNDIMKIDYQPCDSNKEFIDVDREDCDYADLPEYIENILLAQFDQKPPSQQNDFRLRTMFGKIGTKGVDMIPSRASFYHSEWLKWSAVYNEIILIETQQRDEMSDITERSITSATIKELTKLQLLIGAPLNHHVLSIENHYVHHSPPQSFRVFDWSWVEDVALLMRKNKVLSSKDVDWKLPIGTSQGMTLKSGRDTPLWRAFSKVLLASYAYKCNRKEDLQTFKDEVNNLMRSHGYSDIAQHAMLGLRRQQVNYDKEEPFPINETLNSQGVGSVSTTRKIQGRARAIFPFSECVKAWFKAIADSVKKHLFEATHLCTTSPIEISRKLHVITALSIKHELVDVNVDGEAGWLTFYDLSAYDRSTHQGLNDIYNRFLKVFESEAWPKCEGMHDDAGIMFPSVLEPGTLFLNELIEGRSTLSGQSDVTVKNNIIHIYMIIQSIHTVKGYKPLDIANALLYNRGPLKDVMSGLIHGDDACLFFSEDADDYRKFNDTFSALGVESGAEMAPIYLKKVPHLGVVNALVADKSLNINTQIKNIVSSKISDDDHYNKMYLGGMQALAGSVLKNRFGEYAMTDLALHVVSMRDTYRLLLGYKNLNLVEALYNQTLQIMIHYYEELATPDEMFNPILSLITTAGVPDASKLGINPELDKKLQDYMVYIVQENTPRAVQLRSMVAKLYYAFGEDFLGAELQEIFALSNYDLEDEMVHYNLQSLTSREILDAILRFQLHLLNTKGEAPSEQQILDLMSNVDKIDTKIFKMS